MSTSAEHKSDLAVSHNRRWAFGFLTAAIVTWSFYTFLLPYAGEGVQKIVREWIPLGSVNESLVWVICAVGLNIVVGYAGLLDLGFVAFWAIGGYTAGWFMSSFFNQIEGGIYFLSSAPPGQPGIHLNWWLVLLMAGAICSLAGIIIGAPTLRLKSDYLALVTLGFGEIIPQVFLNGEDIAGFNLTNGAKGIAPLDNIAALPFGPKTIDLGSTSLPSPSRSDRSMSRPSSCCSAWSRRSASSCRCGSVKVAWVEPGSPSVRTSWPPA